MGGTYDQGEGKANSARAAAGEVADRFGALDFAVAQVIGVCLLTTLGVMLLWSRPIPADIYPTFAFRANDGWPEIFAFVLVNACATSALCAAIIATIVTLARRGRRFAAAGLAALVQVALLFGALMGTGAFVSRWRWMLIAILVLGSGAQMLASSWLWRRVSPARRGLVILATLGGVAAVASIAILYLGHFATLYASVFAWLYVWAQALCFAFATTTVDRSALIARRTPIMATAAICLVLAAVELSGWAGDAFLPIRRAYDWRCPEAAALFNVRKSTKTEWYKARAVLTPARGAATDDALLTGLPAPTRRLNVVVFVIDALRRDHVGALGYTPSPTPNIDRLATRSTVYTDAYSPSPTTGYSIVSFMSGLLPQQAVESPGPLMFLPRALRHFGWDSGASSSFDGLWNMVPVLTGVESSTFGFDTVTHTDAQKFHPAYDAAVTSALIERVTAPAGAPRFEYIHLFGAHGPFRTDDPVADYDAALRQTDAQLGRFLDALERTGRLDDTILIVMGDHGEGLGEHGMFAHSQSLYVEQTAVPLIMWIPDAAPRSISHPVTLNILPALVMQALGSSWPLETRPTANGLRLNEDVAVQDFHIRSEHVWRAIRRSRWSYHHRMLEDRIELYDLEDDPAERRDVAAEHPHVVDAFRQLERRLP